MEIIFDPPKPQPGTQQGLGGDGSAPDPVIDVTEANFMAEVIQASQQIPVVIDFWATWCGPCKQLTPVLEKVVRGAGGRVRLAKIDIDKNQRLVAMLAQQGLRVQSVPTVVAVVQGQLVPLFQGALPESQVRQVIEQVVQMAGGTMPTEDLMTAAKAAGAEGRHDEAAEILRAVLAEQPENAEAIGLLGRALIALGQSEEAAALVANLPANVESHAEVQGVKAALEVAEKGREAEAQLSSLQARLAADSEDHAARFDYAVALNAIGHREEAAEQLLQIMRRKKGWNDDAARLQLLKFFEAWGLSDDVTVAARRRLSTLLFS
ncbi:thioredoxin family protein [Elioraea rosea]|uniref:thioredoxin family protein n=1 Tax=Elioraea rosea TaxID=2492390 RepID=UPI0011835B72|nr:co-chaperone YbbN [Elioraea rosea]